ncbi:zinc finger protein Eos isoform X3 [Onychostruthus taczanowskii]|uniref:zinc finger protein Eos isoform X3 n=1 Tax=Onychostruthus taczanowskii TaxID=356909 RepID=UPI001B8009E6|nr:zinc finger protein Eos isoform X3 [Onychostruthus taczanowskii]
MDIEDCNARSYITGICSSWKVSGCVRPASAALRPAGIPRCFPGIPIQGSAGFLPQGRGDSPLEQEFHSAVGGGAARSPPSPRSSPRSPANSIKVEMSSDEGSPGRPPSREGRGGLPEDALPEPFPEPFPEPHSPGGIRLPNGKLKCDVCGMVCIGPNVLMVHKRSHTVSSPTVGKPYKCSSCGRSYKQQSSLEEHRERCHGFLQRESPAQTGEEIRELDMVPEALLHPERPTFIERLAGSFTKRKRSTPQKFVGEKQMRFALSELPFDVSPGFDKDVEVVPARGHALEPPYAGPLSLLGAGDPLRPLRLATNCITEVTPVISSVYTQIQALPARLELPRGRDASEDGAEGIPVIFRSRAAAADAGASPSNGCQDSTDTESIQEERAGGGSSRHSPAYAKEEPKEEPDGAARCFPKESLRVLNEEGEQLRAFCCEHCRVLFLDHVMFTIHMGCHGFRDPFECNICGYRSQDRYEFSSHIVRGEHKM